MSDAADRIGDVLSPDYKKAFYLIVAVIAAVIAVIVGLGKAEAFVDGRVELKMADQRRRIDEQEKKTQEISAQFASFKETLTEIRIDVRMLRQAQEQQAAGSGRRK